MPSVYWWVGVTPASQDPASAPDNHSDLFYVDEAGIQVGLRSLLHVAVDYLQAPAGQPEPRQQVDRETPEPVATFVVLAGDGGQCGIGMALGRELEGAPGADLRPAILTPCRAASRRGSG